MVLWGSMWPTLVCQAIAKAMIEVFLNEGWLKLLESPQSPAQNKLFILSLAEGFLAQMARQQDMLKFLEASELKPVAAAWHQIARFCRACLVAFAHPVEGIELSDQDLFWFSEYKGSNLFDRSIKAIITKEGWWAKQLEDVARTASTRPLSKPGVQKLKTLLDKREQLTARELQEVGTLFEEVQRSLRETELESISDAIVAKLRFAAEALSQTADVHTVSSDAVDTLLKLLTVFGHRPGVPSIQESFAKWATGVQTLLRRNKFMSVLKSASLNDVNFKEVKELLDSSPSAMLANPKQSPDMLAAVLHFLDKGCQFVIHKARFATAIVCTSLSFACVPLSLLCLWPCLGSKQESGKRYASFMRLPCWAAS